jgi:hypothetical protein
MAIPAWPTANDFPQSPQKGFSESVGLNVIRSPMDAGPAKQRLRARRPSTMDLSFILTTAQTQTLEEFINTTLEGVKRFSFPHPRLLGTTVETRIVPGSDGEFFRLQYLAPGYWQTSLKFEILP